MKAAKSTQRLAFTDKLKPLFFHLEMNHFTPIFRPNPLTNAVLQASHHREAPTPKGTTSLPKQSAQKFPPRWKPVMLSDCFQSAAGSRHRVSHVSFPAYLGNKSKVDGVMMSLLNARHYYPSSSGWESQS